MWWIGVLAIMVITAIALISIGVAVRVSLWEEEDETPISRGMTLAAHRSERCGMIRVEEWPEGLVLWVGGEIRWREWLDTPRPGRNGFPLGAKHNVASVFQDVTRRH